MKTNTSMTLYHKRYNPTIEIDVWDRYPIAKVMWQEKIGANFNKGYEKSDDVRIWIPYNENNELNLVPISKGDIVVKGNVDTAITKQSDLSNSHNILTYVNNDYGSENIQHIYIGAK